MSALKSPLKELLDSKLDSPDADRLWQRFQERARPQKSGVIWKLTFAVSAAAAIFLYFGLQYEKRKQPLELVSGEAIPALIAAEQLGRSTLSFSDGSLIELAPRSRLEVVHNSAERFVTRLKSGSTTFAVRPGGARTWVVESELANIEVVGTRFSVAQDSQRLVVQVSEGSVLVRGERVVAGAKRLSAGQSLELFRAPSNEAQRNHEATKDANPESKPAQPAPEPSQEPIEPSALPPVGPSASARDPVEALLKEADSARARGERELAISHLEKALALTPADDPRRAVIGLTLARVRMKADPNAAAE